MAVPAMPPLNLSAPAMSSSANGPLTTGAKYFGQPASIAAAASPLMWVGVAVVAWLLLSKKKG